MTDIVTGAAPAARPAEQTYRQELVWIWQIRLFHWCYAAAIVVLFATGLYIADPFLTASGDPSETNLMGTFRLVHFIAAAVFCVAFFWRIFWFWFGGHHARSGFPFVWRPRWWRDLGRQLWDYLRLDFGRAHMGHNALAGLSYTLVPIFLGWGMIFTGLAMYSESNPDGLWGSLVGWVLPLLGGSFRTHMWHHLMAWGFAVFVVLHVYIVLLDGHQYRNGLISSMISGHKFYDPSKPPEDDSEFLGK